MIVTNKTKFVYYFFGTLMPRLISFTFLPILSFFLSKNELGEYDLFLSSLSLLVPILTFQIEEAYYRWHFEAPKNLIKTVIYFSFLCHLLFLAFSIVLYHYHLVQFNFTLLLAIFSSSFLLLFQFIARSLNRMSVYSIAAVLNIVGILVFTFLFLFFQKITIKSIAIAYIISNLVTLLFFVYKLKLYKTLCDDVFDCKLIIQLLKFSVPLIPNTISWWMVSLANRYIITFNLGVGSNGSYAVAARLPSLLILLNTIFLLCIQDLAFKNEASQKNEMDYNALFKKYLTLQITIAIVLIAFSKLFVNLLFSHIYSDAYKLVPIIVLGIIFTNLCAFFAVFFLAQKKTFFILFTTILGGILNIVFTQVTILQIGLYAPAFGTAIGFLFICVLRLQQLKKYHNIQLNIEHFIGLFFVFIITSISLFVDNIYLESFFIIASALFFYFINKSLLIEVINQLFISIKRK